MRAAWKALLSFCTKRNTVKELWLLDLSEWIMQGLNQINERFNRIEGRLEEIGKDVCDLKEQFVRVEEKLTSIPQIEKKLWSLQRNMWIATGILIVIVFLARIFLPDFDITITPK